MTTIAETRQLVKSFIQARQDPTADALPFMAEDFTFESPMMRFDDQMRASPGTTLIRIWPSEPLLLHDPMTEARIRTRGRAVFVPG